MLANRHGANGPCSGQDKRLAYTQDPPRLDQAQAIQPRLKLLLPVADCSIQVGFSVLATLPESDIVYPMLGRPQDSLLHAQKDPR